MITALDSSILTIVTFIPLAGALLLLIMPRRDRETRWLALGVSVVAFLASLHLPVHLVRNQSGFQFEVNRRGFRTLTFITTWAWMASPCGWWC